MIIRAVSKALLSWCVASITHANNSHRRSYTTAFISVAPTVTTTTPRRGKRLLRSSTSPDEHRGRRRRRFATSALLYRRRVTATKDCGLLLLLAVPSPRDDDDTDDDDDGWSSAHDKSEDSEDEDDAPDNKQKTSREKEMQLATIADLQAESRARHLNFVIRIITPVEKGKRAAVTRRRTARLVYSHFCTRFLGGSLWRVRL
jgi:hypothetical protein